MFWFILLGIVVLGFAIFVIILAVKDHELLAGLGAALGIVVVGGALAFMLAAILNLVSSEFAGTHPEEIGESQLAALNDGSSTSGSFFLGSGYFEEDPAFFYYQKDGEELRLRHVPASQVVVVESSDQPRIEVYDQITNNRFWSVYNEEPDLVKFYVPEGSVISNYTLDGS